MCFSNSDVCIIFIQNNQLYPAYFKLPVLRLELCQVYIFMRIIPHPMMSPEKPVRRKSDNRYHVING
ncbi:hypothetical protein DKG79_10175 [Escherichia fergusonii]|nr:hypothetical protein DKG79_10175 [Escherichia fergusonii]